MKQVLSVFAVVAIMGVHSAFSATEKPSITPEQKKTVEAFVGNWSYQATLAEQGSKQPFKTKFTLKCTKAALGKAAGCTMKGNMPDGLWEASAMVGYDPFTKSVHFMSVTSSEEVHDHTCQWKDEQTLSCDPLKAGMGANPITEELSFKFEGKKSIFTSVTKMKDGKTMIFEGIGNKN